MKKLNQIKTKEYKNPYKIHKVPVKPCLFNHFIMTSFLKMTKSCFYDHYSIYDYTCKYMKAMKSGNAKEITPKCNWARRSHQFAIIHYFRSPWIVADGSCPILNSTINQNFMFVSKQDASIPMPGNLKIQGRRVSLKTSIFLHPFDSFYVLHALQVPSLQS